jgi:oleandomycin transport system ATP-binding protein
VTDPGVLPAVVRRLDDAGVLVTELALRGSSLNEVFLNLTGRPTPREPSTEPEPEPEPGPGPEPETEREAT